VVETACDGVPAAVSADTVAVAAPEENSVVVLGLVAVALAVDYASVAVEHSLLTEFVSTYFVLEDLDPVLKRHEEERMERRIAFQKLQQIFATQEMNLFEMSLSWEG